MGFFLSFSSSFFSLWLVLPVCVRALMYIYIYIEREREREREKVLLLYINFISACVFACVCVLLGGLVC